MMKSLIIISSFVFSTLLGYCQVKSINTETVSTLKKGSTTKSQVKSLFGSPSNVSMNQWSETWFYANPGDWLTIHFDTTGRVSSYNYETGSSALNTNTEQLLLDRQLFFELIGKVQNDKKLTGSFMYKGKAAIIVQDNDFHTAIGKFMKITWKGYTAYYHNTLGYMTRVRFLKTSINDKQNKISKNKYCGANYCVELRDEYKLPYIAEYTQGASELREIK